jgi:hypothetical protein
MDISFDTTGILLDKESVLLSNTFRLKLAHLQALNQR